MSICSDDRLSISGAAQHMNLGTVEADDRFASAWLAPDPGLDGENTAWANHHMVWIEAACDYLVEDFVALIP